MFRNQPNCAVDVQVEPAQQMVLVPVMSRVTPSVFRTNCCCCRLASVSV